MPVASETRTFRSLGPELRERLLPTLTIDGEAWVEILRLADRALDASAFGPCGDLRPAAAAAVPQWEAPDTNVALGALLEHMLKQIWWVLDPDAYAKERAPTLFHPLIELRLLTKREANSDLRRDGSPVEEMSSMAAAMAFRARMARNGTAHSNARVDAADLIGTLLHAVFLHREALRSALGATCSTLPADFGTVNQGDEYHRHVRNFVGRETELEDLEARLSRARQEGGWVLVSGPEGQGKSALVSALLRRRAERRRVHGTDRAAVLQRTPWVGGGIVAYGKTCACAGAVHVAQQLLAQANALLDQKVTLDLAVSPARASLDGVPVDTRPPVVRARDALAAALRALVEETGEALLVLEALDEHGAGVVDVLPPTLPAGAVGILTCRANHEALQVARHALRPLTEMPLRGLSLDDTGRLVTTRAGTTEETWVRALHEANGGTPLLVQFASERLREHGGDTERVDVRATMRDHFEHRARRWRDREVRASATDPRYTALLVLSVLERGGPAPWSDLRAILRARGMALATTELHELLEPVASELVQGDQGDVQLAVNGFARYVREERMDAEERAALIGDVSKALAVTQSATFRRFYAAWATDETEQAAAAGLGTLLEAGDLDAVVAVFNDVLRATADVPETLLAAMDAVVEREPARGEAGAALLSLAPAASTHAVQWLERGAEAGHPVALQMLASALLVGIGCERDVERGMVVLERAAQAGNRTARWAQLDLLLTRPDGEENVSRALRSDGSWGALTRLAVHLHHGRIPEAYAGELAEVVARARALEQSGAGLEERLLALGDPRRSATLRAMGLPLTFSTTEMGALGRAAERGSPFTLFHTALAGLNHQPDDVRKLLSVLLHNERIGPLVATHVAIDDRLAALRPAVVTQALEHPDENVEFSHAALLIAVQALDWTSARTLASAVPTSPLAVNVHSWCDLADHALPKEERATAGFRWLHAQPALTTRDLGLLADTIQLLLVAGTPEQRASAREHLARQVDALPEVRVAWHALDAEAERAWDWVSHGVAQPELWAVGWIGLPRGLRAGAYERVIEALGAREGSAAGELVTALSCLLEADTPREDGSPAVVTDQGIVAHALALQGDGEFVEGGAEDSAVRAWVAAHASEAPWLLPVIGSLPLVGTRPTVEESASVQARWAIAVAWLARHDLFGVARVNGFFLTVGRALAQRVPELNPPSWIFEPCFEAEHSKPT